MHQSHLSVQTAVGAGNTAALTSGNDTCRSVHTMGQRHLLQAKALPRLHPAQAKVQANHLHQAAAVVAVAAKMSPLVNTAVHRRSLGVIAASLG